MGITFYQDGYCKECKGHAEEYCDFCQKFVCDEHLIEVEMPGTTKVIVSCPECFEKKSTPVKPIRNYNPPFYK